MDKNIIGHYIKHIDNGGPEISVALEDSGCLDDDGKLIMQVAIKIEASYHGHSYLDTTLHSLCDGFNSTDLKEIGIMFLEAASKLKEKGM